MFSLLAGCPSDHGLVIRVNNFSPVGAAVQEVQAEVAVKVIIIDILARAMRHSCHRAGYRLTVNPNYGCPAVPAPLSSENILYDI